MIGKLKQFVQFLLQPSAKWSVAVLLSVGLLVGVISVIAYDTTMHMTSTEEFCTSCHEMETNPYAMLQETSHFKNKSGVRPICADCHVPKEFFPKMVRKIQASREVWGHMLGVLDTPEKYAAHAPVMKERELARMRANDSQECRNCHEVSQMVLASQTAKAQKFHSVTELNNKTCIDCHAGLAHTPPGVEVDQTGM